ncbi:hypothetical protein BV22DRAFT_1134495 [Leucogyrophana mollusca]|uniref:Uncharacterized protein n=1 Tax=Leucogyrophana mollusca TaxID=85980 RepID=A0ACB8B002_9AGAM|nr:hypothetical protein BV22DRAFT_1134495 [Leucogyrophana mollusca]
MTGGGKRKKPSENEINLEALEEQRNAKKRGPTDKQAVDNPRRSTREGRGQGGTIARMKAFEDIQTQPRKSKPTVAQTARDAEPVNPMAPPVKSKKTRRDPTVAPADATFDDLPRPALHHAEPDSRFGFRSQPPPPRPRNSVTSQPPPFAHTDRASGTPVNAHPRSFGTLLPPHRSGVRSNPIPQSPPPRTHKEPSSGTWYKSPLLPARPPQSTSRDDIVEASDDDTDTEIYSRPVRKQVRRRTEEDDAEEEACAEEGAGAEGACEEEEAGVEEEVDAEGGVNVANDEYRQGEEATVSLGEEDTRGQSPLGGWTTHAISEDERFADNLDNNHDDGWRASDEGNNTRAAGRERTNKRGPINIDPPSPYSHLPVRSKKSRKGSGRTFSGDRSKRSKGKERQERSSSSDEAEQRDVLSDHHRKNGVPRAPNPATLNDFRTQQMKLSPEASGQSEDDGQENRSGQPKSKGALSILM